MKQPSEIAAEEKARLTRRLFLLVLEYLALIVTGIGLAIVISLFLTGCGGDDGNHPQSVPPLTIERR